MPTALPSPTLDTKARQEKLIVDLQARLSQLRAKDPSAVGLPCLTCAEARTIGQTLIKIRALTEWGEFTHLLPRIGLTQPEASVVRRIARDWHTIEVLGYHQYRAFVAYQKLVKHHQ
jgi:hypothetical protein